MIFRNFTVRHRMKNIYEYGKSINIIPSHITECQWKDMEGNDHAANFLGHMPEKLCQDIIRRSTEMTGG